MLRSFIFIMESKFCGYCKEIASYECPCTFPFTFVCKKDLDMHLSLSGDHIIRKLQNVGSQPNPKSKTELINKISQIKAETLSVKNKLLVSVYQSIKNIKNEGKKLVERLDGFVETCEKVIKDIISIKEINQKQFYSPLENALISNNIESLLSKFYAPRIIKRESEQLQEMFTYNPSLFLHFLYNYSDLTFAYPSKHTLIFYPLGKKMTNEKFKLSLRGLTLYKDLILIAGPESKTFILNIETETIFELFDLNQPRKCHAMA